MVRIFKKNPLLLVSLSKVDKVRGQRSVVGVSTKTLSAVIDLGELTKVALNSDMRENIPDLGKETIIGRDDDGTVIDATFPIETPKVVMVNPVKAGPDKADTQLSLFDLFEKDKQN